MHTKNMLVLAATAVLGLSSATALAGEAKTFKGSGTYTVTRMLMPLANGGAAVLLSNDTVATWEPSESGFMNGDCAGLGYISPEGKVSINSICTFAVTAEDGFVIRTDSSVEGGTVKVIGGSGKWKGATGTGKMTRRWIEGSRGSYDYELTISTP